MAVTATMITTTIMDKMPVRATATIKTILAFLAFTVFMAFQDITPFTAVQAIREFRANMAISYTHIPI